MTDEYERPRKLYRVRTGFGLGVCHGIAEYFEFPAWLVQAAAIFFCLLTGVWPGVIAYFAAAFIMKPKPGYEYSYSYEPARHTQTSTAAGSWQDIKDIMARLDRRIQRMENVVTSREYDWERRLNR